MDTAIDSSAFAFILNSLAAGIIATIVVDLWNQFLVFVRVLPSVSWGVVGRWVIGFRTGGFYAPDIGSRPPHPQEEAVGWAFHYLIGITYGVLYVGALTVMNAEASPANGALFGIITLVAPMLIMQPALGGGLFGVRSPNWPRGALLSFCGHTIFGAALPLEIMLVDRLGNS